MMTRKMKAIFMTTEHENTTMIYFCSYRKEILHVEIHLQKKEKGYCSHYNSKQRY